MRLSHKQETHTSLWCRVLVKSMLVYLTTIRIINDDLQSYAMILTGNPREIVRHINSSLPQPLDNDYLGV
jgi:hypothetical protein